MIKMTTRMMMMKMMMTKKKEKKRETFHEVQNAAEASIGSQTEGPTGRSG